MKLRKNPIAIAILLGTLSQTLQAQPTVYIPLGSANSVIAVDGSTDVITQTYTGVANPHGLVATPDGEYLIAGSLQENPSPKGQPSNGSSDLFVVHPAHGHVMATVPVDGWTHHQAITPDGRYVLSTHPTRGAISVLDMNSNQIVKTVKTGPAPNYTLIPKDGKVAFVSNSGNGTISEIDLVSWRAVRILEAGPAPEHMVFSRSEESIFITNPRAGTVSEVAVDSGKVIRTFDVGRSVHGLDMGDDGITLFASSKQDDKLAAIDTRTGKVRTIQLSPAPYHLNTITGTGKVYVSSRKQPKIWVVDQADLKVLGEIKLPGGEGHQMAVIE